MHIRSSKGFTLIELVIVIVILGILAAVAIPKFINLTNEAQTAAVKGVAGALASASASNYGARVANNLSGTSAVSNCTDVGSLLVGGVPSPYAIAAQAISGGNGTTVTCTVSGTTNGVTSSATFQGIAVN